MNCWLRPAIGVVVLMPLSGLAQESLCDPCVDPPKPSSAVAITKDVEELRAVSVTQAVNQSVMEVVSKLRQQESPPGTSRERTEHTLDPSGPDETSPDD